MALATSAPFHEPEDDRPRRPVLLHVAQQLAEALRLRVPPERCRSVRPPNPKTSRHAGECKFAAETNPAVLKVLLKVKDGAGEGYWWVECGACDTAWQVANYAAEKVG